MKYCIQCTHLHSYRNQYLCKRPIGVSLVTGENQDNCTLAEIERTLNHTGCGEDAIFFEKKGEQQ